MTLMHHENCDNRVMVMVRREILFHCFLLLYSVFCLCQSCCNLQVQPFWKSHCVLAACILLQLHCCSISIISIQPTHQTRSVVQTVLVLLCPIEEGVNSMKRDFCSGYDCKSLCCPLVEQRPAIRFLHESLPFSVYKDVYLEFVNSCLQMSKHQRGRTKFLQL